MSDHKVSGRRAAAASQPRREHHAAFGTAGSHGSVPHHTSPAGPVHGPVNVRPAAPAGTVTRRQLREQERARPALRHATQRATPVFEPAPAAAPSAFQAPAAPVTESTAFVPRAEPKKPGKQRKFVKLAAPLAVAVTAVSGLALTAFASPGAAPAPGVQASTSTPAAVVSAPADSEFVLDRSGLDSSYDVETKLSEILVASGGEVAPAQAKGTLAAPLTIINPTSGFGFRQDPLGRGQMMHTGQDFGIACGTDVFASAAGTVTEAGFIGYHGNRVVIDHGNGLKTTYNHNSGVLVKVGDIVERGALIAKSGTTGNSTGCHLHFEVMVNDNFVDPAGWL